MTIRFYSSIAQQTNLTGTISPTTTSITVADTTGLPSSTPFTLALDYGSASEELVDVTSIAGLSMTIDRAVDGTSATTHPAGAIVRHVSSARDFADSRAHENASMGVHGIDSGSSVVGTTDTQTLTNKTFDGSTFSGATVFNDRVDVNGANAAFSQFDITGAVSQTASLQRWLDSDANTLASVNAAGLISGLRGGSFTAAGTTGVGLISKGVASQTGDLQEWQDSTGTVLASVQSDGKITGNGGMNIVSNSADDVIVKGSSNAAGNNMFRVITSTNAQALTVDDTGLVTVGSLNESAPTAWSNYTPTWTTTGTAPQLNSGTLAGRYTKIHSTIHFEFNLTFAGNTNPGTGTYSFALPTVPASSIHTAHGNASGSVGRCPLFAPIVVGTPSVMVFAPTTTTSSTYSPLTGAGLSGSSWVDSNTIRITGTYETA